MSLRVPFATHVAGTALVAMLAMPDHATCQTRGSPLPFESVYGAAVRAGLEFRHDGELEGGTLTAMMNGPKNIVLKDEKGEVAAISTYDVYQSNGVIQVIDKVVMPR